MRHDKSARSGDGYPAAGMPLFLRFPRAAGLWLIGVLIPVATLAALVLSYRGLFDWARTHSWPWYLAPMFPLLIDVLIVAGEVVLFTAAVDGKTPRRVRAAAWGIVIVFTGLSVVGNVSHASTGDYLTRGGWGLPPLVLAVALGFGLGELKRQAAKYRTDGDTPAQGVSVPGLRPLMGEYKVAQPTARKIQEAIVKYSSPAGGRVDQQDRTPAQDGSRGYHVNAEPAHLMASHPAGVNGNGAHG